MSKSYEVCNPASGHSFGFYCATSAEDAIRTCCLEAGYTSVEEAEEVTGHANELIATRIDTVQADSDEDDGLKDAADKYACAHGLAGWDLRPRWENNHTRDTVILTIPDGAY